MFPGINYKPDAKTAYWAQYGVSPPLHLQALYLQAYIKTGKHVILNPAYLYLNNKPPGQPRLQEHTLMNAVIVYFPVHRLVVDDRNMIWNRFRRYGKDLHFYRNRLRVSWPIPNRAVQLKPYLFDELTFSFTEGSFTRNRVAAGLVIKPARWFQLEVTWLREYNRYYNNVNLLFVMTTIELGENRHL
ncbi:hypothetical protein FPE01S_03_01270 [Flavihumibacter petaseus NBRC 106054]|uniref:DUF2490 domain-containing protein n=2 Tax=Flavihumibacter TaxID=1004301 RepID=A0A0E9N234_9BACT|nr:hypothetical protein FPE01S_03_01270 [Flavihumibacter petaseus NBRC 106054]